MSAFPNKLLFALTVLMGLAACTRVAGTGAPEPPEPRPEQPPEERVPVETFWGGTIAFDGQELPVLLELRAGEAEHHQVVLHIPELSMEAHGEGRWSGDRIRADLSYGAETACPGRIDVDVRVSAGGAEARGDLTARDCTGSESGPLLLVRRESGLRKPTGVR